MEAELLTHFNLRVAVVSLVLFKRKKNGFILIQDFIKLSRNLKDVLFK